MSYTLSNKVLLFSALCGLPIGCSARNYPNSDIKGEMSTGGGRYAAYAVRVSFASFGAGIDAAGALATRRFLEREKQAGNIRSFAETSAGREGEVQFCADYADTAKLLAATEVLGRVVWVGTNAGHLSSMQVGRSCASLTSSNPSTRDRGPFYAGAEAEKWPVTLSCSNAALDPTGIHTVVEASEKILSDKTIAVKLTLKRSSPTARYPLVAEVAETLTVITRDTRTFALEYKGKSMALVFWPQWLPNNAQFLGRLSINGDDVSLNCSTNRN